MIKDKETIGDLIRQAYREHWALGQFNLSNLETIKAIVQAANESKSPVIVGVSMGTVRHAGLNYLHGLMIGAKEESLVPIFFHLDHGPDFEIIKKVIDLGFDSVMLDTSRLPVDENVKMVHEVVEYGHAHGICVEAQIGETWDEETNEEIQIRTDPFEARDFAIRTGVDYLAISFGNTPGRIEGEAEVDIDLIRDIARVCPVPIVLHGGTSIPDNKIREAIQVGAAKINIDTAIRKAVTTVFVEQYRSEGYVTDPRVVFKQVSEAAKKVVKEKMKLFGSTGRATLKL